MAELNEDTGLITLRRDREFPAQWHLLIHTKTYGEVDKIYMSLGHAMSAIAAHMHREVETGSNWLKR